jgi:protein gp37
VENQKRADERLPFFKSIPVKNKYIICAPLLTQIDLSPDLGPWVEEVSAGGESGENARPCDFEWIKDLRRQCMASQVPFHFRQTGARFIKDGKLYRIKRKLQHAQAKKAGIDFEV